MNATRKGNKISLRPVLPSDFEKVLAWENNPENWRVSGTTQPYPEDAIRSYVNSPQDIFTQQQCRFVICRNDTGEAVGAVDFFEFDFRHQRMGVGILIETGHRQQGFASEGLKLAADIAMSEIGARNLFANILADNVASISLFEKAGFVKAGHKNNWFNDNGKWIDELFYQLILVK